MKTSKNKVNPERNLKTELMLELNNNLNDLTKAEKYFPELITLNVRGFKYKVILKSFDKHPSTRLGKLSNCIKNQNKQNIKSLCDGYDLGLNEFYFDRDPFISNKIFSYYAINKLHINSNECVLAIKDELEYWQIDSASVELCCQKLYDDQYDSIRTYKNCVEKCVNEYTINKKADFGRFFPLLREKLWNFFEKPKSSILAQAYFVVSIIIIGLTTLITAMRTLPEFDDDKLADEFCNKTKIIPQNLLKNSTILCQRLEKFSVSNLSNVTSEENYNLKTCYESRCLKKYTLIFEISDYTCIIWFSLEYLIRFISCPNKITFIKSVLNVIDLLFLLSNYADILKNSLPDVNFSIEYLAHAIKMSKIFLILKLSKYYDGLKVFVYALKTAYVDLLALIIFLTIGIVFFSSAVYIFETDFNPQFSSVPATFWWTFITMTTVGYGDIVPITIGGKIFGCLTIFAGIVILAMPVGVISNKYAEFSQIKKIKNKLEKSLNSKHK